MNHLSTERRNRATVLFRFVGLRGDLAVFSHPTMFRDEAEMSLDGRSTKRTPFDESVFTRESLEVRIENLEAGGHDATEEHIALAAMDEAKSLEGA